MLFHFFCFLIPSQLLNKMKGISLKNKFDENIDDGYDFRYEKNVDIDYTLWNKFHTKFLKNEILINIVDKDISSFEKLNSIEYNLDLIFNKTSPYLHNLLAGGLLKDFDFDIDKDIM